MSDEAMRFAFIRVFPVQMSRRQKWLGGLVAALVLYWGVAWWANRLTVTEQAIVSHWTHRRTYPNGRYLLMRWEFRSNHTCHIHNTNIVAATSSQPARQFEDITEATWKVRDGQLLIDPERPIWKRLNMSGMQAYHRVRNALTGTKVRIIDGELCTGRVSDVGADHFTVTWWDPYKEADSGTIIWTREAAPSPAAE